MGIVAICHYYFANCGNRICFIGILYICKCALFYLCQSNNIVIQ